MALRLGFHLLLLALSWWPPASFSQAADALDDGARDIVQAILDSPAPEVLLENDIDSPLDGHRTRARFQVPGTQGKYPDFQEPGWRTAFLGALSNPNIVIILGMIGIYGLILLFYNSGTGTGTASALGVLGLLAVGFALRLLPLDYAGLALVILGLGLLAAEVFMPSLGVMGAGGVASFIVGAIVLIDSDVDAFQVSGSLGAALAAFLKPGRDMFGLVELDRQVPLKRERNLCRLSVGEDPSRARGRISF